MILLKVVQNLRISTLELRGEDSPDVTPYTHDKQIEPVCLNLSKHITDFLEQFLVVGIKCFWIWFCVNHLICVLAQTTDS